MEQQKGNVRQPSPFFHHHLEFFVSPLMLKKLIVGKEIAACKSSFYNKPKRMVERLG